MALRQWGWTPAGSAPAYVNAAEREDGTVEVTVRQTAKADGSLGDTASITMDGDNFRLWINSIASDL